MDSNNGPHHIGIGEREGKIFSSIVKKRNYFFVHGIGRSGNIGEIQPKALGSSVLNLLTNNLLKNFLHSINFSFIKDLIIFPSATGMTLTLCYLTLKLLKPKANYVIWSRIDQKSCLKSIITSGLIPIIIPPIQYGEQLQTDIKGILKAVEDIGTENILCVSSTMSCFAPRAYDSVEEIAKICKENNLFHIVNNAYGVYCTKACDMLNKAVKIGKVDLIISSTDKNFCVPVAGAFVYSSDNKLIEKLRENYPGRASIQPILDLFITFLELGQKELIKIFGERKKRYNLLKESMKKIAYDFEEKILELENNKISLAFTLANIIKHIKEKNPNFDEKNEITELGSYFYKRQISGIRILTNKDEKEICGIKFKNFGVSSDNFSFIPYMTFACSIGTTEEDIQLFIEKFPKILKEFIEDKSKTHK